MQVVAGAADHQRAGGDPGRAPPRSATGGLARAGRRARAPARRAAAASTRCRTYAQPAGRVAHAGRDLGGDRRRRPPTPRRSPPRPAARRSGPAPPAGRGWSSAAGRKKTTRSKRSGLSASSRHSAPAPRLTPRPGWRRTGRRPRAGRGPGRRTSTARAARRSGRARGSGRRPGGRSTALPSGRVSAMPPASPCANTVTGSPTPVTSRSSATPCGVATSSVGGCGQGGPPAAGRGGAGAVRSAGRRPEAVASGNPSPEALAVGQVAQPGPDVEQVDHRRPRCRSGGRCRMARAGDDREQQGDRRGSPATRPWAGCRWPGKASARWVRQCTRATALEHDREDQHDQVEAGDDVVVEERRGRVP